MLSKRRAITRLRQQLGTIPQLANYKRFSNEFSEWQDETSALLSSMFGDSAAAEFLDIKYNPDRFNHFTPGYEYDRAFRAGLEVAALHLNGWIEEVIEHWPADPEPAASEPLTAREALTPYIEPLRLEELRSLNSSDFDLSRLIRIVEETHISYTQGALHAVAALTRALIDHVPPIFGFTNFTQIANNYSGAKSFRDAMRRLQDSARPIADAHLHTQIRSRESLPTRTQVNFANEIDLLLAEIARLLRSQS